MIAVAAGAATAHPAWSQTTAREQIALGDQGQHRDQHADRASAGGDDADRQQDERQRELRLDIGEGS